MKRILIIGGYGNFGMRAARLLAKENDVRIIIAGRDAEKANSFAASLGNGAESAALDIFKNLKEVLAAVKPDIVIHTSGPFQKQDYFVARECIAAGCHYIDLADARSFVCDIGELDATAKERGISVISGASSVPALGACVIDEYKNGFADLLEVDYSIATAQKTSRGLATTTAVLGYAGKPFLTLQHGRMEKVYGWLDPRFKKYPELGWRMLGNCDIPDLDLFPLRYPSLRNVRFQAAIELPFLHFGVWLMSWLVRLRLLPPLDRFAKQLLAGSDVFDFLGTNKSAFCMTMRGRGKNGPPLEKTFFIVARQGDGLYIPVAPAVLCALKLARGELTARGAFPCMGLISLEEYQKTLIGLDMSFIAPK